MLKDRIKDYSIFLKLENRINNLSSLITKTKDIEKRELLLREYLQLYLLLEDLFNYTHTEPYINKYIYEYFKLLPHQISNIRGDLYNTLPKFQEYLVEGYANIVNKMFYIPKKEETDLEKMIDIPDLTEDFLGNLDYDILNKYREMVKDRRIYEKEKIDDDSLGVTYSTSLFDNREYILLRVPYTESDHYAILSHELGHVFEYNNSTNNKYYINREISKEVTSILFQRLFYDYMINNSLIPDDYKHHKASWDSTQGIYTMCFALVNSELPKNRIKMQEDGLLKYIGNDPLVRDLLCYTSLDIHRIKYIISDMIACRLLNIFNFDINEGKKELFHFYKMRDSLDIKTLLKEYCGTREFIMEYDKSYQYSLKRN